MQLKSLQSEKDIPEIYQNTPIADLICYQNFKAPFKEHKKAEILVGMCMDNRKQLVLPENFAYILRTGGANLRYNEFKISYAVAIGNVRFVALIAHNHCGMVNLVSRRQEFVEGLMALGWDKAQAEEHFETSVPMFEIDDEKEFVLFESQRLAKKYKGVTVVPLYYTLEDNLLSLILP